LIRTAAYLLDAFLLSLVGGAFPYLFLPTASSNTISTTVAGGGIATSLLVSLVYFVLFWSSIGAGRTLGMRIFRLRVVSEGGRQLELRDAFVRWIGLWISFLAGFIGVLWVAGDSRKQGWHDKMAHTLVVRA